MKMVDMKVVPSYLDEDMVIAFHFEFHFFKQKIGSATVYTYAENNNPYDSSNTARKNKKAVIKDFSVIDDFSPLSMTKLVQFLKKIGIRNIREASHYTVHSS
jgi:hypothetical protein